MTEIGKAHVTEGLATEYAAFAELVAQLDAAAWSAPTRCTGWQVRDVVGHVTGTAIDSADGTIGARTPDQQARALRDSTPQELAAALGAAAARLGTAFDGFDDARWATVLPRTGRTVLNGVLTLWYDTFVHADDIRAALGQPSGRGPGLAAGVHWLRSELDRLERGPATLKLTGLETLEIGSGGPVVGGDPLQFLLVATGRLDPALLGLDESFNVYSVR
ncbi:maleylpyruvate isomerase family mycothiol-dependent enzyme [Kitasatospora sp. NBC_00240]|uniref:maleylpyruvate isomerase family mycothiol-dependent enzyme n=1 Tax=Kitasatospora sp. NBC_00240 TaxID=2903567 RepID=UPI0022565514|nr:maleylpyruvate isomerase family mycothiol-dependent enzyme [Kitasatospora sp. NBC_00240]MCX5208643.1 maleylpyruvate isomerase family mycothiol-dependent enzyme [Kitasatospora sp. NBC_00240]